MTSELHIISLASILALVYWLINAVPRLAQRSDNEKQALVFVAVFVAGIADNAVFFSDNAKLVSIVTTLYQLAVIAAGAVGTLKVAQKVSRGVKAVAEHRQELWRVDVEAKRAALRDTARFAVVANRPVLDGANG